MNWLAILVASASTLVVGFVWYHKSVFGTAWMKTIGKTEEDLQGGNMAVMFGVAFVMGIIVSMFLTHDITFGDDQAGEQFMTFQHGAFHGLLAGLMVAMPVLTVNALFEQKGWKYIAINVGYWVVSLTIVGGIVSVWR